MEPKIPEHIKELEKLAQPLVEWLRDGGNPLSMIVISWERAELYDVSMSVPFRYDWNQQATAHNPATETYL